MSCAEFRSLIGGYVLQALEPDEAATVQRHLASCPDCAREHEELAPIPALLDAVLDPDAAPAEPPAGLEDAVLDRFARDQGPREPSAEPKPRAKRRRLRAPGWLSRPLPAAALAAVAAAAITFGLTSAIDGGGSGGQKSYGAHLRVVAGGAPGQGADPAPAARPYAYARLSRSASGTRVQLKATGLTAAPGTVYELWCVYPDGSKVSAGTFRAGPGGRAEASMTTAARVGEYHRLSVELRNPGQPGRRILAGDIAY